jgi:transposase
MSKRSWLWASSTTVRCNEWTRSQEQLELRRTLARAYRILGRAIALREALQEVLADGDLPSIRWWLGWADRSRLEPFGKLSRDHFHGILAYRETRLANAAIEAVNSLLQMAKRIARGIAAYLKAGRLNLQIPHALPT